MFSGGIATLMVLFMLTFPKPKTAEELEYEYELENQDLQRQSTEFYVK